MKQTKNKFFKDLIWYLAGSAIPLLTGFFRVPIFTRYFTASEYGVYGIILITYTILSVLLFSWLSNCIWRFYTKFKKENKLLSLYSNLFFLYFIFAVAFLAVSIIWNQTATDNTTKRLTILISIQLIISNLNNYFLIVHRLEERSALFNIITGLRAVFAFGIQYFLTFKLDFRIEAIPISMIIIESLVALYLIPLFYKQYSIRFSALSKHTIQLFLGYSIPGLLSNLGLYILTSSDRYVIALFEDIDKVGIYNQVYNLCQISIIAIINLFLSIIQPTFIREMELNFKATTRLTSIYLKSFLLLLLPITVYYSIYAKTISDILLGPEFRIGYTMIPWIAFALLFYGITLFSENRLKFNSKYKAVIIGFIISALINLVINFITIPLFGYNWAAISTLISYFILMLFFLFSDYKLNDLKLFNLKELAPAILLLISQIATHLILKHIFNISFGIAISIIEGVLYAGMYVLMLFFYYKRPLTMLVRITK